MKTLTLTVLLALTSCGPSRIIVTKGKDAVSCSSESVEGGVNVICGDQSTFIENGKDGENSDFNYVEICPNINGSHIETLLHTNNTYIAFLSDKNYKKQRMVVLDENVLYTTTDERHVQFTINNDEIRCL